MKQNPPSVVGFGTEESLSGVGSTCPQRTLHSEREEEREGVLLFEIDQTTALSVGPIFFF